MTLQHGLFELAVSDKNAAVNLYYVINLGDIPQSVIFFQIYLSACAPIEITKDISIK